MYVLFDLLIVHQYSGTDIFIVHTLVYSRGGAE